MSREERGKKIIKSCPRIQVDPHTNRLCFYSSYPSSYPCSYSSSSSSIWRGWIGRDVSRELEGRIEMELVEEEDSRRKKIREEQKEKRRRKEER